uniref:Uncharacterized protein n=1 Tax=Anopheles culicifacies TaxID=139723 RepID=A0A182MRD9_9DIPT
MQPNLTNKRLSICGWKKAGNDKSKLVPWDVIDRLVVPIICCHAAAILISGALNLLRISQVSALVLFILFSILTVSGVFFYHSLTRLSLNIVYKNNTLLPEGLNFGLNAGFDTTNTASTQAHTVTQMEVQPC